MNRHQISPSSRSTRVSWHQISPSSRSTRVNAPDQSFVQVNPCELAPDQSLQVNLCELAPDQLKVHHPLSPLSSFVMSSNPEYVNLCICLTANIASVVTLTSMKPNCVSLMWTCSVVLFSKTLSTTYIECSITVSHLKVSVIIISLSTYQILFVETIIIYHSTHTVQ